MEAPADVIEDAAVGHAVEGGLDDEPRPLVAADGPQAQQPVEQGRLGELGARAEPGLAQVELAGRRPEGSLGHLVVQLSLGGHQLQAPLHARDDLLGGGAHVVRPLIVCLPHRPQHLGEAAHAGPVLGGKVGAPVERLQLGSQEHRQRPAARTGQHVHGAHVDAVQVGAFLAVNLDADEVLVHQPGDLRVFEALPRHDVAPVTGRVADAEQDGLVLAAGPLERLLTPGVPVHGVVSVLTQVGAGATDQPVGSVPPGSRAHARPPRTGTR